MIKYPKVSGVKILRLKLYQLQIDTHCAAGIAVSEYMMLLSLYNFIDIFLSQLSFNYIYSMFPLQNDPKISQSVFCNSALRNLSPNSGCIHSF